MKYKNLVTAIGLSFLAFLGNIKFAKFDYDPHHDGYIVAIAIAVRDHGVVFRDVFSQYGSMSAWIQGYWLRIFFHDQPILGLRVLNVLFISAIVFLLAMAGNNMPKNWHIKPWMGYFASLSWLVLNDVYTHVPMLPWPALIATFFTVLGFVLTGKSIFYLEMNRQTLAIFFVYLAGASFTASIFTRQSIGALNIFAFYLLIILSYLSKNLPKKFLFHGFISSIITLAIFLIQYAVSGVTKDWINQTFIWPASNYASNGYLAELFGRIEKYSIPLLLFLLFVVLQRNAHLIKVSQFEKWFLVFKILLPIYIYWYLFINIEVEKIFPTAILNFQTYKGIASLLEFVSFSALALIAYTSVNLFVKIFKRQISADGNLYLLFHVILGFSCMTQIFPVSDSRHLWWGLPLALLLLFALTKPFESKTKIVWNPIILSLIIGSLVAAYQGYEYLKIKRLPAAKEFATSGMYLNPEQHLIMRDKFEFLIQNIYPYEKAMFLSRNGDLSVFDGKYHSMDPYFVYWGPSEDKILERLKTVDTVVVDADQMELMQTALDNGFEVYSKSVHVYLLKRVANP